MDRRTDRRADRYDDEPLNGFTLERRRRPQFNSIRGPVGRRAELFAPDFLASPPFAGRLAAVALRDSAALRECECLHLFALLSATGAGRHLGPMQSGALPAHRNSTSRAGRASVFENLTGGGARQAREIDSPHVSSSSSALHSASESRCLCLDSGCRSALVQSRARHSR